MSAARKGPERACPEEGSGSAAVNSGDDAAEAVRGTRENAVRRLPVMDDSRIVGMVALGELAVERDEQSALAGISAARPII